MVAVRAPGGAVARRRVVPAGFFWLLAALIFALLILRRPDCVTNPQFWAEDGALFFRWQILFGFKTALVSPYNGYVSVLSRIIAGLASFLPVYYAPLIYAVVGSAIDAICCSIFFLPWFRQIVRSDWVRAGVCILTAVTPPADELVGTVVNAQWYLLLAGTLLLFRGPISGANSSGARPALRGVAWGLLGLLLPLTNPVLIFCVPFCIWNIVKNWRVDRWYEVGVIAGLTIQLCIFVTSGQTRANLHGRLTMLAASVVTAFVYRAVISLVMGYKFTVAAAAAKSLIAPLAALIATAAVIGWVLWKGDARTRWKVAILLYIAAASLAVTLGGRNAFPAFASIRDFHGFQLERYLFLAGCSFIYLMAVCLEALLRERRVVVALGLLVLIFGVGTVRNYRIPAFADQHWRESARLIQGRLDRHEIGGRHPVIRVPILPDGWDIILD